jgi:hypothetical protein
MAADLPVVMDHSVRSVYSDPRGWAGLLDEIEPTIEAVAVRPHPITSPLIDDPAQLLTRADEGDLGCERELFSRYHEDDRLRPGSQVRSSSPNDGSYDVDLSARTTRPVGPPR